MDSSRCTLSKDCSSREPITDSPFRLIKHEDRDAIEKPTTLQRGLRHLLLTHISGTPPAQTALFSVKRFPASNTAIFDAEVDLRLLFEEVQASLHQVVRGDGGTSRRCPRTSESPASTSCWGSKESGISTLFSGDHRKTIPGHGTQNRSSKQRTRDEPAERENVREASDNIDKFVVELCHAESWESGGWRFPCPLTA
jgi:hypothetical protein